jgi:hypothetical protein
VRAFQVGRRVCFGVIQVLGYARRLIAACAHRHLEVYVLVAEVMMCLYLLYSTGKRDRKSRQEQNKEAKLGQSSA